MRHQTLADATDLVRWADRRDAQSEVPRLLRRLVIATVERVVATQFRAGEGVQLGGWDGLVRVDGGNAFVPDGVTAWEIGTDRDLKGKADDDYEKRKGDPAGVDPAAATFVFVTPRRWGGKDAWATARRSKSVWRDVRAYDADDIEGWLDLAPAVHVWISSILGRRPPGVVDLETHWAAV